jgi:TetR/AcrR family transcriptional repressor of nem operon
MPYPARHRDDVRKRIVDSARRQFNRKGFEGASIIEIMQGAGLTHGGFYSYFRSKSDLYREAMNCFFTDPDWKNCWEGVQVDLSGTDIGPQIVRAYLSRQHFEDIENSCPMVALPSDVARSGPEARQAFEKVFLAMVSLLERSLQGNKRARSARAQAISAMSIGGMVVARALDNLPHADALRDSCLRVAMELGGWDQRQTQMEQRHNRRSRAR